MNISFEKLEVSAKQLAKSSENSYWETYEEMIAFFKNLPNGRITKHHFVVGTLMVYGWMPRTLLLRRQNETQMIELLNVVRKGGDLEESQLCRMKKAVNNSMVGLSKLLHFICPDRYVILDSRIYKLVKGVKSAYGLEKPGFYLEYLRHMRSLSEEERFTALKKKAIEVVGYEMSNLRCLELLLFQAAKNQAKP